MSYRDPPLYLSVDAQRAAVARRRGTVAVPPPSADAVKAALAKRVAAAMKPVPVAKRPMAKRPVAPSVADARSVNGRSAPRRAVVASGLRSDSVSLTLQSPDTARREMGEAVKRGLAERVAATTAPKYQFYFADDAMICGSAAAPGGGLITITGPVR